MKYATALNCLASIYSRACAVMCEWQLGKINKHSKIKRPHPSFLFSRVFFSSSFPLLCHSPAEWQIEKMQRLRILCPQSEQKTKQRRRGKIKAAIFGLGEEGGEGRSMYDRDKHSRDREGGEVLLNIKIPPTKKREGEREKEWVEKERKDRSDTCSILFEQIPTLNHFLCFDQTLFIFLFYSGHENIFWYWIDTEMSLSYIDTVWSIFNHL